MKINCPHCPFSQQVADDALPPLPSKVTCPQCSQSFTLEAPGEEVAAPAMPTEPTLTPPPLPTTVEPPSPPPSPTSPPALVSDEQPAGFWVRVLAAIIDSVACNILVFGMGFAFGFLLQTNNYSTNEPMQLLLMLMSIVVTVFYYVFFTGYCGQTPGKMALSIKVIHNDGHDVGYGRAFIRETIGKTISGLLLCIGYLMVAMRSDKRGLHDLIASTRVIKL
ncbi:MAG: RDD family protein [Thermodesulfobacteriota bacterium]|nr:RDD family protein [Thermodesulfobacteriota bacterium]